MQVYAGDGSTLFSSTYSQITMHSSGVLMAQSDGPFVTADAKTYPVTGHRAWASLSHCCNVVGALEPHY